MVQSRIVLVTGATSGIGRATALLLARSGHRVLATGRKAALLNELEREAAGLALETFLLDVSDRGSIDAAVGEIDRRTDGHGVDVLVNNAGFGLMAPLELVSEQDVRAQLETNVIGLLRMTQALLPAMRKRRAGTIVNVGSIVGKMSIPLQGVYCATKHAVEALSDALRIELRAFGIHVALVEPGTIRTEFGGTIASTLAGYEAIDSPYRPALARYQRMLDDFYRRAPGPACIARVIARIVAARRPRARYVAPFSNKLLLWLVRAMPTRLLDWIMRRMLGLTPASLRLG